MRLRNSDAVRDHFLGESARGGTTGNDLIQARTGGGGTLVVLNGVTFGPYAGVTSVALNVYAGAAIDELWGDNDSDWFFALTSGLTAAIVKDLKGSEIVTALL